MSSTGPSRLPDRFSEALRAFPWRSLVLDLAFVVAWVAAVSVAFRTVELPVPLYYAVVFGGVLGYSLFGPSVARRLRGRR